MRPLFPRASSRAAKGGKRRRRLLSGFASVLGALLVAGLGFLLTKASFAAGEEGQRRKPGLGWIFGSRAEALARLSYDLQFVFRGQVGAPEGRIVYFDERSAQALGQRMGVWDRRLHAQLVRRLTAEGARAILFDLVFSDPWPDPTVDDEFAAAMKENGRVFIGAALELDTGSGAIQERTVPPTPVLRRAAAGWGLLVFRPVDSDYAVRQIYTGMETIPSATWRAAEKLGAGITDSPEERTRPRWMNYYGSAATFQNIGYDRALAPDGVPSGFFRDRIVVVGGRSTLGDLRLGKDEFRNPYSVLGGEFAKGPEVHLTALLNLLHREWLTRVEPSRELRWVVIFGILLGGMGAWFRPHAAAFIVLVAIGGVVGFALFLLARNHEWFAWCIPALVQAPVALVWAVGSRYFIEERRRNALREAFAHYLSPQMADRIADADFDLSLGGTVVEATVMFTDLENFAPLAEELDNPERISEVLTTYFTLTTGHILENDGTIVKYLGDSVQAVWGAPLPDALHERKAVLAAWRLYAASKMEVQGHPLRTRVGLNTGLMLSGNLGSVQRFDYALTGDSVNFASRLEGLNKYLGTGVLISDSVQAGLDETFVTRCVGEFRVVGKKVPRVIYELLGPAETFPPAPWLECFASALSAFRDGNLDAAQAAMNETISLRGGDGPSRFYLERIAALRVSGMPADWSGIVELSAK